MKLRIDHSNRKYLIFIAIILMTVFIKVSVDVSALNSGAKTSLSSSKDGVKAAVESLNTDLSTDSITKSQKIDRLTSFGDFIKSTRDDLCKDQQVSLYAIFSAEVANCNKAREKLGNVSGLVDNLGRFIADETALAAVIPSFDSSKSYDESYQQWQVASKSLKSIEVGGDLSSIKSKLVDDAEAYTNAWKDLASTNSSKNANKFDQAIDSLNNTYSALKLSVKDLDDAFKTAQNDLSASLNSYYNQ